MYVPPAFRIIDPNKLTEFIHGPSASSTFKFGVGRKRGQAPKAASGPQGASHFWCLTPFPKLT